MAIYLKIKAGEKLGITKNKYEKGMRIYPVDAVLRKKMTEVGYLIFPDKPCTQPKAPTKEHERIMLEQNSHLLSETPMPFESLQICDPPALRKLLEHNKVVYPPGINVPEARLARE